MANIRITRELLEYALDLPEGVEVLDSPPVWTVVDDVPCLTFMVDASTRPDVFPGGPNTAFALQYEEGEEGLQLALAVPLD